MLYIKTLSGREVVVVLEAARHLSETDRALVEIFCSRLSIAFDNVILYEQLQRANARLEERVAAAHPGPDRPPTAGSPRNGRGCGRPTPSRARSSAPSPTI